MGAGTNYRWPSGEEGGKGPMLHILSSFPLILDIQ